MSPILQMEQDKMMKNELDGQEWPGTEMLQSWH